MRFRDYEAIEAPMAGVGSPRVCPAARGACRTARPGDLVGSAMRTIAGAMASNRKWSAWPDPESGPQPHDP